MSIEQIEHELVRDIKSVLRTHLAKRTIIEEVTTDSEVGPKRVNIVLHTGIPADLVTLTITVKV